MTTRSTICLQRLRSVFALTWLPLLLWLAIGVGIGVGISPAHALVPIAAEPAHAAGIDAPFASSGPACTARESACAPRCGTEIDIDVDVDAGGEGPGDAAPPDRSSPLGPRCRNRQRLPWADVFTSAPLLRAQRPPIPPILPL